MAFRFETANERWRWYTAAFYTESLTEQFIVDTALNMLRQAYPNVPFDAKSISDPMPPGFGAPDDAVSSVLIYATNGDMSWLNDHSVDLVEMAILDAKKEFGSQKPGMSNPLLETDQDEKARLRSEINDFNESWYYQEQNQPTSNPFDYWAELRSNGIVLTPGV